MGKKDLVVGPRESKFQQAASYAVALARLMRFGMPRVGRKLVMRPGFLKNDQECARRRLFHKVHGTAIGGGSIWNPGE